MLAWPVTGDVPPTMARPTPPAKDIRKPMAAVGLKKLVPGDPPLDVNRATQLELQKLPGVGPALAERIFKRRVEKPFESIEELTKIKGIKGKLLEKIRPVATVGTSQRPVANGQ